MAYTPKDLTGRIFSNQGDKTNDKQPDYSGTINVRGEIFRVAAWHSPPSEQHRTANFGLVLTNKDEYDAQVRQRKEGAGPKIHPNTDESAVQEQLAKNAPPQDDFGDDVPF